MPVGPQPSSDSPVHRIRLRGPWQVAEVDTEDDSDWLPLRSKVVHAISQAAAVERLLNVDLRLEFADLRSEIMKRNCEPNRLSFPSDWCRWKEATRINGSLLSQSSSQAKSVFDDSRVSDNAPSYGLGEGLRERWFWLSRHFGCPTGLSQHQTVNLVLQNFSQQGIVFLNAKPLGSLDFSNACWSVSIHSQLVQRNLLEILVCNSMEKNFSQNETAVEEVSIYLEM